MRVAIYEGNFRAECVYAGEANNWKVVHLPSSLTPGRACFFRPRQLLRHKNNPRVSDAEVPASSEVAPNGECLIHS